MAVTQSQVDALRYAIRQGVTDVSYGDKRVTYRSLAEMRQILNEMEDELLGRGRTRQVRMTINPDRAL